MKKNWFKALIFVFLVAPIPVFASAEDLKQDEKHLEDFTALSLESLLDTEIVNINVLGTHTHLADEWMIGYRYMFMEMNGNRTGTEQVSNSEVLSDFMVSPLRMSMQMHMVMLMYAPSDNLTLMAMAPFIKKEMDHETLTGVKFTTNSDGIGDIELKGIYAFYGEPNSKHRFFISGGFSLPTGSVNERDTLANPARGHQKLPYPMQLGSGTVDFLPGPCSGTVALGSSTVSVSLGTCESTC